VFHTDLGNELRNKAYNSIVQQMSFLPRLSSPTIYLNTLDKVKEFKSKYPDFTVNTVEDYCQPGENWPSSSGVIGVWASTYLAYKAFLETDYEFLVIFEDDASISKNIKPILNNYVKELPHNWDFFSFFVPDDSLFAFDPNRHDVGQPNICVSYQQWSCAGYIVSRKGAQRAIKDIESRGVTAPIDWYMFNFRMKQEENQMRFNTYTLKPNKYRPIKLIPGVFQNSQIHNGSTELYT
jgi:GR25 family glycosyltransferase involved in LPS biosynthesis